MTRTMVRSMAVLVVVTAFASVRGNGGQAGLVEPRAAPTDVVINGFTFRGALSQEIKSAPVEAESVPLIGAETLLMGKDKVGGNVQLFWSGGAAPYDIKRWNNLIGFSTPAMETSVNTTSYDDPVLYDGLNESWVVN